jgi:alpha-galactosidase
MEMDRMGRDVGGDIDENVNAISRRAFVFGSAMAVVGATSGAFADNMNSAPAIEGKPDPSRIPSEVVVVTESQTIILSGNGKGRWEHASITVETEERDGLLRARLSAPGVPVKTVRILWSGDLSGYKLMMGDHWERSYGDLCWASPDPSRVMPWYMLAFDGERTDGFGVVTGASSLCCWRATPSGLSLIADVRCGGRGVELGGRVLPICAIAAYCGKSGESPYDVGRALCARLSPTPRLASHPIYGSNDWYHTYGEGNSSDTILRDAQLIASLAPSGENRPYAVVDAGWQLKGGCEGGPWDRTSPMYPDMPGLASDIVKAGAKPGIWIRPLAAADDLPAGWRLSRDAQFLDPTVPEALAHASADIARLRSWGYGLIKHDFTTFDISGTWGASMGDSFTADGWTFADKSVTTAEAILKMYRAFREAAGASIIIGCNTIGHLGAGLFELNRIGDDVSGKDWKVTRKMGVNTLAFRAIQNNSFYAVDADCFAMVKLDSVPWEKNRQWLDLLARSGTPLFISATPSELGSEQQDAIRQALAFAVKPQSTAEPLDWLGTPTPKSWRLMRERVTYDWD